MPLSDPWLPSTPTPLMAAIPIAVVRVHTTTSGGVVSIDSLEALPNVECLSVAEQEGPDPATALFAYVFGQPDATAPQTIEQALDTSSTLARVVEVGDRLAVSATRPDGTVEWLFDGFPYEWGLQLDGESGAEIVTMTAMSVAKRCRDLPIPGALLRHSDQLENATDSGSGASNDVATDDVAQFNPRGVANAVAPGTSSWTGTAPSDYPVFTDTLLDTASSGALIATWTLPMAARYLLFTRNKPSDGALVTNPKGTDLDALLVARQPIAGTGYDPNDPSTYTTADLVCPDTPLTGRDWPTVLYGLVRDLGFGMRWPVTSDSDGHPTTALNLFHRQLGPVKSVWLPPRGTAFDPAACNLQAAEMSRDLAGAVNQWTVFGGKKRYEVALVLAPGFPAQASDAADSSALAAFDSNNPSFRTTAGQNDKYRLWIFDEAGEGYYANHSTTLVTPDATHPVPSLDAVFGAGSYARRRRKPVGTLFQKDANGKPYKAALLISTDYGTGGSPPPYPGLWDGGTGTWQEVQGGWGLLPDRLGIRITARNPNGWNIGKSSHATDPYPAGVVKAVDALGNPGTANPAFWLLLVCTIEADQCVKYTASRASTSPLSQIVERQIDARDRYLYQAQAPDSWYNPANTSAVVLRDDTDRAKAEAIASRIASEAGVFHADPIEIPYCTRYYAIGDRIDQIAGRGLGLRTDSGGSSYAPVYPVVVGRRWELKGGQRTFLTLSDEGAPRQRFRLPPPRPKPPLPRGGFVQLDPAPRTGIAAFTPVSERDNGPR